MSTRAWQVYCMFVLPPVLLFCCGRAGALEGISGLPELLLSSFCFGSLAFFGWAFGFLLGRCKGRGGAPSGLSMKPHTAPEKRRDLKDIEGRRGRPRARQLMCPPARHTQHIYLYASALPTFQDSGGRCLTCCCGVRNLSARFKHISPG